MIKHAKRQNYRKHIFSFIYTLILVHKIVILSILEIISVKHDKIIIYLSVCRTPVNFDPFQEDAGKDNFHQVSQIVCSFFFDCKKVSNTILLQSLTIQIIIRNLCYSIPLHSVEVEQFFLSSGILILTLVANLMIPT